MKFLFLKKEEKENHFLVRNSIYWKILFVRSNKITQIDY